MQIVAAHPGFYLKDDNGYHRIVAWQVTDVGCVAMPVVVALHRNGHRLNVVYEERDGVTQPIDMVAAERDTCLPNADRCQKDADKLV